MMTARERIERALRQINGDFKGKCFHCKYQPCFEIGGTENQKKLGFALVMLGVAHGTYKTFALVEKGGFDFITSNVGLCGESADPDPDWQRFIDEVVSIVGE